MLFQLAPEQLLPTDQAYRFGMPEAVIETDKRARDSQQRLVKEQAAYSELSAKAAAAPDFDRNAAEAAIAVDEPTPKPTAATLQRKADEAKRVVEAADKVAHLRIRELFDCGEDHHDEMVAASRANHERALEEYNAALERLQAAAPRLQATAANLAAIESFHNNPNSASLSGRAPSSEVVSRQIEKETERQRASLRTNSNSLVERNFPAQIAALRLLAEG